MLFSSSQVGMDAADPKCWNKEQVQQSYWRIHCESILSGQ